MFNTSCMLSSARTPVESLMDTFLCDLTRIYYSSYYFHLSLYLNQAVQFPYNMWRINGHNDHILMYYCCSLDQWIKYMRVNPPSFWYAVFGGGYTVHSTRRVSMQYAKVLLYLGQHQILLLKGQYLSRNITIKRNVCKNDCDCACHILYFYRL